MPPPHFTLPRSCIWNNWRILRAKWALKWVTVSGFNSRCETFISVCDQPPRSTQPGHPFVGRRNEYQPKGGDADALRLGSKGRCGSCVDGRYNYVIPLLHTGHIWAFRAKGLVIKRDVNSSVYFYFTLLYLWLLLLTRCQDSRAAAVVVCRTERSWRPPSSRCPRTERLLVSPVPTSVLRTTTERISTAINSTLPQQCYVQQSINRLFDQLDSTRYTSSRAGLVTQKSIYCSNKSNKLETKCTVTQDYLLSYVRPSAYPCISGHVTKMSLQQLQGISSEGQGHWPSETSLEQLLGHDHWSATN